MPNLQNEEGTRRAPVLGSFFNINSNGGLLVSADKYTSKRLSAQGFYFHPSYSEVYPDREKNSFSVESLPHFCKYKTIMWETFGGILTQHEIDKVIDEAIKSLEEDSIG